jgi:glycosyltransferase involved in cell wall biosynthesis
MRLVAKFLGAHPFSYYWIAARLERFCLQKSDGVVAISRYTEQAAKPFARKTWLLPNPVHPSYFKVNRTHNERSIVFCAAAIGERKNQLGLIRALEPLRAQFDFEVRFAGAGQNDDPYFQEFGATLSRSSWCTYLGSLNRDELQQQLASTCLAVLPSFEDNCPMVILEAAAAGVPVAASRVGGIPDLIRIEETGLLFDPTSPVQIAEAIRRILLDRPFAARISANARAEATARFDPRVIAEGHLEIYREVLKRL